MVTIPAWANENNSISVEVVKHPTSLWRFKRLRSFISDEGVRVKGHMSSIHRYGLPKGHIDIAAYSPNGELIAETTTGYTIKSFSNKAVFKGEARFTANFATPLPSNAIIKVAYHAKKRGAESNSEHDSNTIAL
jgi:hypothetical protein